MNYQSYNQQMPHGGAGAGAGDVLGAVKQMLMSIIMLNGQKEGNKVNESMALVYSFLAMGIVESIIKYIPILIQMAYEYYVAHTHKSVVRAIESAITAPPMAGGAKKQVKTASIVYSIEINGKSAAEDLMGVAIVDYLTNFHSTKSITITNGIPMLSDYSEVQLADDVFARLIEIERAVAVNADGGAQRSGGTQKIEVYSYTLTMTDLRKFMTGILLTYNNKVHNKLGDKLYYFTEAVVNGGLLPSNAPFLVYSMQEFQTNRRFDNLFGPAFDKITRRVKFFINNRKWYDAKGIPYTLGLLLSGPPGTGKTSIIKCLANETNRYIVNVHLNATTTKSQFHHLFFNENLVVHTADGRTEQVRVPIDRRIYVLEDIDCQGNYAVLERQFRDKIEAQEAQERRVRETQEAERRMIAAQQGGGGGNHRRMVGGNDGRAEEDKNAKLTLSFILNTLDGILETPGRIVVMSANLPEKLDRALIRPGRVDIAAKLDFVVTNTIFEIVEYFFDRKLSSRDRERIQVNHKSAMTPAEINQVCFEHRDDFERAIEVLVELISETPLTAAEKAAVPVDAVAVAVDATEVDATEVVAKQSSTTAASDDCVKVVQPSAPPVMRGLVRR